MLSHSAFDGKSKQNTIPCKPVVTPILKFELVSRNKFCHHD